MAESGSVKGIIGFDIKNEAKIEDEVPMGEILLGTADWRSILMNFFIFFFFALIISIPLITYAFASGGMQWIIVLLVISILALYITAIMRRGIQPREQVKRVEVVKDFTGDLSRLTESVKRGGEGFNYSQQIIREQIAEAVIHKVRLGRGISHRQMTQVLDEKRTTIVGDDDIMDFMVNNQKSAEGWTDKVAGKRGDKKEGGARFINEVDEILKKAEVWN